MSLGPSYICRYVSLRFYLCHRLADIYMHRELYILLTHKKGTKNWQWVDLLWFRVACQQGAITLPDTWFRPPFWDLLMLQLLRPNSSNLPCLYSTLHLEYPLVLSRFCFYYFCRKKNPIVQPVLFAKWFVIPNYSFTCNKYSILLPF